MNRPIQITIAAVLTFVASLYSVVFAIPLLARGAESVNQGTDAPPYFIVLLGFAFGVLGLIAAYGLWRNQRWGKILAVVVMAVNGLSALPGIFFAPTPALFVSATIGVVTSIVIIVLALWPARQPAAVQA